jgi:hypothetical protein
MHLTYRDSDVHKAVSATDLVADGAPEIEVTPAMIEAAVSAWSVGDPEMEPVEEIVERIVRAALSKVGTAPLRKEEGSREQHRC